MSEIDLIEFWFENPELWFNCSDQDDLWITNLFGNRVKFKILSSREDYLKNLEDINFFKPKEKRPIMIQNLRNIFSKMELSDKETRILSSVFASLGKKR